MTLKPLIIIALTFIILGGCSHDDEHQETSGAGQALDQWYFERSYPNVNRLAANFTKAYQSAGVQNIAFRNPPKIEAIGPDNIGGRTLALAFDVTDPETIYAASASGGLWKSHTTGKGADAWERMPLGFPVLGIGAVATHPLHPNVILIGTGEVYNNETTEPGVVNRFTRGTYGIGILISEDRGVSWRMALDWRDKHLTGVQEIEVHPQTGDIFAATSEGLLRSEDLGNTWSMLHELPMAVDIELHPRDPNMLYVSHGSFRNVNSGVYRSVDRGATFQLLGGGLPNQYSGKAMISLSKLNPKHLIAQPSDYVRGLGIWSSEDSGNSWRLLNTTDIPRHQGWYSHDIIISPFDDSRVLTGGIEIWNSNNGGLKLIKKTKWNAWYLGNTKAGEPEGPPNYVHADIHKIYYHPSDSLKLFIVSDGGIFASEDGGETFEGRNGGYQTSQFYANFASSPIDPYFAVGGMQDNASAIYRGEKSWFRVLGADGMSASVHKKGTVYAATQSLTLYRSDNEGESFRQLNLLSARSEQKAFNAPFELSPNNGDVVFAGGQKLHKSTNGGYIWNATSAKNLHYDNVLIDIAISPESDDLIFASTVSLTKNDPKVLRSIDGGGTWEIVDDLPDRVIKQIKFEPQNGNRAYAVVSGYGSAHVYLTTDAGESWQAMAKGELPDVPTNAIVIDQKYPNMIYVGNDFGIYHSNNSGLHWEYISHEIIDAIMVMDLSISPLNRKLRIATHGNGVYEMDLLTPTSVSTTKEPQKLDGDEVTLYPNPASNLLNVRLEGDSQKELQYEIMSSSGILIQKGELIASQDKLNIKQLSTGLHILRLGSAKSQASVVLKFYKQ